MTGEITASSSTTRTRRPLSHGSRIVWRPPRPRRKEASHDPGRCARAQRLNWRDRQGKVNAAGKKRLTDARDGRRSPTKCEGSRSGSTASRSCPDGALPQLADPCRNLERAKGFEPSQPWQIAALPYPVVTEGT